MLGTSCLNDVFLSHPLPVPLTLVSYFIFPLFQSLILSQMLSHKAAKMVSSSSRTKSILLPDIFSKKNLRIKFH